MHESNLAERATAARQTARRKLAGTTPRARGLQKTLAALRWVYAWGWSAPEILSRVAGDSARRLSARLEKAGLLAAHPTPSGGLYGMPQKVMVLTRQGVELIEADLDDSDLLGYPSDGERLVAWHQLRHDLLVQRFTVDRLVSEKISGYLSPRQFAARSASGVKQPDAVWLQEDGSRLAIEVELTAKRGREFDTTIKAIVDAEPVWNFVFEA